MIHLEADGGARGDGHGLGVGTRTSAGVAAEVGVTAAGGHDGGVHVGVLANILVGGGGLTVGDEGGEAVYPILA